MAGTTTKGVFLNNLSTSPTGGLGIPTGHWAVYSKDSGIYAVTNGSGEVKLNNNDDLLAVTAALTGILQTEITINDARDTNQDTLIAQISGGQLAASVGVIAGIVTCVSGQRYYHVPHATIYDMTKSVPQISLTIPASGDTISVMGIFNRSLTDFYVELSDAPSISGYFINFNITNLGTTVYQITGSLMTINSHRGDTNSDIQIIGGTAIAISGNGSTITVEVTGTLGDPALRTEVGIISGFIESQIAVITARDNNQDVLIANISANGANRDTLIAQLSGNSQSVASQIISISANNLNQDILITSISANNFNQDTLISSISASYTPLTTTRALSGVLNTAILSLSGQYLSLYGGTVSGGGILHRIGNHPAGFNDFPNGTAVFIGSTSGSTYAIRLLGMNGSRIQSYAYGGTPDSPTGVSAGTTIAKFDAHGYDGSVWTISNGALSIVTETAWTSGSHASNLQFITTSQNTTAESAKAVLWSDGSLQLGGTFGVSGFGAGNFVASQMISAFGSIPVALSTDVATISARVATNTTMIQTVSAAQQSTLKSGVMFTMDGGGTLLTTGLKGFVTVPYNGTISGWVIIGDVSGTAAVDVWKTSYANFPATVANTIVGSDAPTLSGSRINENLALTSWTTGVTAGDIFAFNLNAVTSISRLVTMVNIIRS